MAEVEYCHEIDEFENEPLKDGVFSLDTKSVKLHRLQEWNIIDTPRVFIGLTKAEKKMFAQHGIDGDNLRKCNGEFIDLHYTTYKIDKNGKLIKEFHFNS